MKTFKFLLACAFACLAVSSCDKNGPQVEPEVDPEDEFDEAYYASNASISSDDAGFTETSDGGAIAFATEGGEVLVRVDCGTPWEAECRALDLFDVSWSVETGILTIGAGQNLVTEPLSTSVTLLTTGSRIVFATVTVTQEAYNTPRISVETEQVNFPAVGALTAEIEVESSLDSWEVQCSASWLKAETTDAGVRLTAEANETVKERSTEVVVTATDGINPVSASIEVVQQASVYLELSKENLTFGENASSSSISVDSNFDWSFEYGSSYTWLTVSRSGDGLSVAVAENDSGEDREGYFTVIAGDGAENVAETRISVTQLGPQTGTLILVYSIASAGTEVTLPLSGTVDCVVDWGEGSDFDVVTTTLPKHVYDRTGEYEVSVYGTVTGLKSSSFATASSFNTTLTAVKQWGSTGLTDLTDAFACCTALSSLPEVTGDALAGVTSFENAFRYCSFENIPEDLFYCSPDITKFKSTFKQCSAITTIPEDLFSKCPAVTSFEETFYTCPLLTEIPEDLFANCPAVTSFASTFYSCDALVSIPAGLFAGCPEVTTFSSTFYSCDDLETVPPGLFDNCKAVTSFYYTFGYCMKMSGESPYTDVDIDGETVRIHLYERTSHTDIFGPGSITHAYCFRSCAGLDDVDAITAAGWN